MDQRGRHLVSEAIRARRRFARERGDLAGPALGIAGFQHAEAARELAAYLQTVARVETARHLARIGPDGRASVEPRRPKQWKPPPWSPRSSRPEC